MVILRIRHESIMKIILQKLFYPIVQSRRVEKGVLNRHRLQYSYVALKNNFDQKKFLENYEREKICNFLVQTLQYLRFFFHCEKLKNTAQCSS